jgi:hypothetical protein
MSLWVWSSGLDSNWNLCARVRWSALRYNDFGDMKNRQNRPTWGCSIRRVYCMGLQVQVLINTFNTFNTNQGRLQYDTMIMESPENHFQNSQNRSCLVDIAKGTFAHLLVKCVQLLEPPISFGSNQQLWALASQRTKIIGWHRNTPSKNTMKTPRTYIHIHNICTICIHMYVYVYIYILQYVSAHMDELNDMNTACARIQSPWRCPSNPGLVGNQGHQAKPRFSFTIGMGGICWYS